MTFDFPSFGLGFVVAVMFLLILHAGDGPIGDCVRRWFGRRNIS